MSSSRPRSYLGRHKYGQSLPDICSLFSENEFLLQAEESSRHVPSHKYDTLKRELKDSQDQAINQKNALEKRLRTAQEECRAAKEESEEVQTEFEGLSRQHKHQLQEIDSKHATLQKTLSDLRADLANKDSALHTTQERLSQREIETGELESEILRLKAQTGDADTLAVIKRELSEQVSHIRKLESTNREQSAELKHFRRVHKAVEVVEEEKRALETRVSLMANIEKELREVQLQRQILEDERHSWTSYLESEDGAGKVKFDSPEDMARALVKQRLENASLLQRIGAIQPDLLEKDEIIKSLEDERNKVISEMEKLRSSSVSGNDSRAKTRLERQRALAVKEVDLLREQLRTFDSEEQTYHSENQFDTVKSQRIADLESLVDQHRTEIQTLNTELSTVENRAPTVPQSPLKRPREEDPDDHQLGQLSRKNRKLQDALSSLQSTYALLQTDHTALQSQLSSLQQSAKTRVLSLRSNPSDDFQATKLSTLSALRQENKDLLARLENRGNDDDDAPGTAKSVPHSTLENLRLEMRELEQQLRDKEKRMLRLKEIFGKKSLEFREAVFSLLGWKTDFRPNGKVALSLNTGTEAADADDVVDECIIFDGENGTMKIAGGPDSAFALQIRPLIRQWVEGRRYIPGLMAGIIHSKVEDGTLVM